MRVVEFGGLTYDIENDPQGFVVGSEMVLEGGDTDSLGCRQRQITRILCDRDTLLVELERARKIPAPPE